MKVAIIKQAGLVAAVALRFRVGNDFLYLPVLPSLCHLFMIGEFAQLIAVKTQDL